MAGLKKTGQKQTGKKTNKGTKERRKLPIWIKLAVAVVLLLPILLSLVIPNPQGTSVKSPYFGTGQLQFLYDLTYTAGSEDDDEVEAAAAAKTAEPIRQQSILSNELAMIAQAKEFILMDMFLFNDAYNGKTKYPENVKQITDALIAKKTENPNMKIIFITDPINGFYGAYTESCQKKMKDSGITVVETDLSKLRDSNFLYSGYYRLLVKPFGTDGKKWITNLFDEEEDKVNIRAVLGLANFKANHRKVLITDQGAMVVSANPHDASAYHSNVGVRFNGPVVQHLIEAERAVAAFSGEKLPALHYAVNGVTEIPNTRIRALTEKEIGNALKARIDSSQEGDLIQIGIFYMSDFSVMKALENAAVRGVQVQIVADPNKDAFGVKKDGSPNRIALSKLRAKSANIEVRWYDTQGEQFHTKMAFFSSDEKPNAVILGSANFTRRNIGGYNLECDMEIVTPQDSAFSNQVAGYFDRIWYNRDGHFTTEFETYEESSSLKNVLYQIQERTGLCTY